MTRIEKVLATGTGEELDALGKLVDTLRRSYSPDREERDENYLARLKQVPLVQLLTYWLEQVDAEPSEPSRIISGTLVQPLWAFPEGAAGPMVQVPVGASIVIRLDATGAK